MLKLDFNLIGLFSLYDAKLYCRATTNFDAKIELT